MKYHKKSEKIVLRILAFCFALSLVASFTGCSNDEQSDSVLSSSTQFAGGALSCEEQLRKAVEFHIKDGIESRNINRIMSLFSVTHPDYEEIKNSFEKLMSSLSATEFEIVELKVFPQDEAARAEVYYLLTGLSVSEGYEFRREGCFYWGFLRNGQEWRVATSIAEEMRAVRGKVLGAAGRPLAGVFVRLADGFGESTDRNGCFSVTLPCSRKISLTVDHPGYPLYKKELSPASTERCIHLGEILLAPVSQVPFPAVFLEAEAGDRQVSLSWRVSGSEQFDGFIVLRRKASDQNFRRIARIDRTESGFVDTGLLNGEVYYYCVRTFRSSPDGDSSTHIPVSRPVSEQPPLSHPQIHTEYSGSAGETGNTLRNKVPDFTTSTTNTIGPAPDIPAPDNSAENLAQNHENRATGAVILTNSSSVASFSKSGSIQSGTRGTEIFGNASSDLESSDSNVVMAIPSSFIYSIDLPTLFIESLTGKKNFKYRGEVPKITTFSNLNRKFLETDARKTEYLEFISPQQIERGRYRIFLDAIKSPVSGAVDIFYSQFGSQSEPRRTGYRAKLNDETDTYMETVDLGTIDVSPENWQGKPLLRDYLYFKIVPGLLGEKMSRVIISALRLTHVTDLEKKP